MQPDPARTINIFPPRVAENREIAQGLNTTLTGFPGIFIPVRLETLTYTQRSIAAGFCSFWALPPIGLDGKPQLGWIRDTRHNVMHPKTEYAIKRWCTLRCEPFPRTFEAITALVDVLLRPPVMVAFLMFGDSFDLPVIGGGLT